MYCLTFLVIFNLLVTLSSAENDNGVCFFQHDRTSTNGQLSYTKQSSFRKIDCTDKGNHKYVKEFNSQREVSLKALIEDTCLFEGWRCSDKEYCVNTQTSFECRCNNRTTGKNGAQCEDKPGTPRTETTTEVHHDKTSNEDTTNGLVKTSTGESFPEDVPSITGCIKLITYDESVYCLVSATLSWEDAEEMCSTFSFHLVVINNSNENDVLRTLLLNLDIAQVWVGYRYNYGQGQFRWSMKSNEYTNWAPDEPDETSKNRCVYMTNDGFMHDVDCNETIPQYHPYVCEFEA